MSDPIWFDQTHYLQEKADSLNASGDGSVTWTVDSVLQAMDSAGLTPYEHYQRYGVDEGINPNQYFDQNYYINAKVAGLNAVEAGGRTDWTASEVLQAIESSGLTPYEHFAQYGVDEGLNPSANFDVQTYLQAKADANNAADGVATWTASSVLAIMESAGLDPLTHYINYGIADGLPATPIDNGGDNGGSTGDSGGDDSGGGDSGGGDSGGGSDAFIVTDTVPDAGTGAHAVSFGGTATGNIDVSITGGVATFTRDGHTATVTVSDLAHATITLAADQTLVIDHADAGGLNGVTFIGAGTVNVTDALTVAEFSGLHFDTLWAGTFQYAIEDTVAVLSTGSPVSLTGSTHVTAQVQASDVNLANNVLWDSVDKIDLNGQNDVILSAHNQANLTIIDGTDDDASNNTGITARVHNGDKDLTGITLSSAIDQIDLYGMNSVILAAHDQAAMTIIDGTDDTTTNNTGITAQVQAGHLDLTNVTLSSVINQIDLHGQTATLNVTEASKTITDTGTGGSYVVQSATGNNTIVLADDIDASVKFTNAGQFGDMIIFSNGTATDKIDLSALTPTVDSWVKDGTATVDGTSGSETVIADKHVAIIDTSFGSTLMSATTSSMATFLADHYIKGYANGESYIIITDDTVVETSAIYHYVDSGDAVIDSGELSLVAIIGNVALSDTAAISITTA